MYMIDALIVNKKDKFEKGFQLANIWKRCIAKNYWLN